MLIIPKTQSLTVAFECQWSEDSITKTIAAFANTAGGDLYIGVDANSELIGVKEPEQIVRRLTTIACERIFPTAVDCVTAEILQDKSLAIVHVHVVRGCLRPYSLDPKQPESVYLRIGAVNGQATLEELAEIIRSNPIIPFEQQPSALQSLTFMGMECFCNALGKQIDPKLTHYGFWNDDAGYWTNLAYLCSDQGRAECICSEYHDDAMQRALNHSKFKGSFFGLLDKVLDYIARTNLACIASPKDGTLQRVECWFVAPDIVRQALINAMIHRDYSENIASRVIITPSTLTISSYGGLPPGLDQDLVFAGMATSCRNERLAALLIKLDLLENVEGGFRGIREAYPFEPPESLLEIGAKRLTIRLPRIRAIAPDTADATDRLILEFIRSRRLASRSEIQAGTGLGRTAACVRLKLLAERGIIEMVGKGPALRYRLKPSLT